MSILQSINQYNHDNVFFCDSIKNNVMTNGNFIRILYCMPNFTMNGVYIHLYISDLSYEKYYQKYKCIFNVNKFSELIEDVVTIEKNLLERVSQIIPGKSAQYKIAEQLRSGHIKIFSDSHPKQTSGSFVLKISGVWETDTSYGLTYKFSKTNGIV
jgi:hypothetical protein